MLSRHLEMKHLNRTDFLQVAAFDPVKIGGGMLKPWFKWSLIDSYTKYV